MPKARLPGNGAPKSKLRDVGADCPKKPPRPARAGLRWHVRIYLGDQCDWYIGGEVFALSEPRAIATARAHVAFAWPSLDGLLDSTPATAQQANAG